ncbi:hypothetical protein SDC9_147480 [bioreactor metagenome]|uniref:Uncharacterized protein n=1 Tax=bioreactor metagenome TaxID=1076179 RepID=A0A645EFS7_9ZZZZ
MRNKGTCVGTARNSIEHWGFNFDKINIVQIIAHGSDDLTSFYKSILHFRTGNQIQITLTVTGVHILEPMEFFWKRQQ